MEDRHALSYAKNDRRLGVGAALSVSPLLRTAKAQTYPQRPVKIIVPYAAGGASDIKLERALGQPFIVDNAVAARAWSVRRRTRPPPPTAIRSELSIARSSLTLACFARSFPTTPKQTLRRSRFWRLPLSSSSCILLWRPIACRICRLPVERLHRALWILCEQRRIIRLRNRTRTACP